MKVVDHLTSLFLSGWRDEPINLSRITTTAVVGVGIVFLIVKKRSLGSSGKAEKDSKGNKSSRIGNNVGQDGASSSSHPPPLPKDGPTFQEYLSSMIGGTLTDKQLEWHEKYGSIFMIPSPLKGIVPSFCCISDPQITKELTITRTNQNRPPYSFQTRTELFAKAVRESVGASLAGSIGNEWKWRRTAFLKEMHKSKLFNEERNLLKEIYTIGEEKLCHQLEQAAISKVPIQVDIIATEAAMDTILFFLFGKVLVGYNPNDVRQAAKDTLSYMITSLMDPLFFIKKYIPGTTANQTLRKRNAAWKVFDTLVKDEILIMIEEAKQGTDTGTGTPPSSCRRYPGSILESWFKNEPKFYERNLDPILGEVRGMVLAGFETTAHALAYSMGMMAERPDLSDKLYEISTNAILQKKRKNGTIDNYDNSNEYYSHLLDSTSYVKNFFMEALRLYPLAPSLGGECTEDIVISVPIHTGDNNSNNTNDGGVDDTNTTTSNQQEQKFTLPKGTNCLFLNFAMQRNSNYLDRPNEIDPDRWEKQLQQQQPFLHTFNNGPHACPGKPLSLLEGQIFLTQIASKFKFEFPPGIDRVMYDEQMLLRPKDGMPLIVTKRTQS